MQMDPELPRILTGVAELDAVLRGGFLRGRIHLIEGRPGTGKTTFGLRYLMQGVRQGEDCLYLTLSESAPELRATAGSHGWSLDGIDIEEMLPLPADAPPPQTILLPTESELSALVDRIADRIVRSGASRVVVDSMVEIRLLAHDSAHYRRQVIALRHRLAQTGATVLMLDDVTSEAPEYELQSAVHCVISLEQMERSFGAARRRLRVVKLRGGDFQSGWHDYAILTGDILVFPSLIAQEHRRPPNDIGIVSGVPRFDAMFGGALAEGSSTMVLGPSGAGKTTLALQYALATVRAGHHVGYFNFDESETTLRSRLVAHMGADAHAPGDGRNDEPKDEGEDGGARQAREPHRFHLRRMNPSRISPGAFIWGVRRLVEDTGARLIIIDSINSYLDLIREEKSLLLQMNELFSYLSNMHVTAIIVGAHSAALDTTKEPDAVSIITDNIITLRYYEQDNVVHKAICVLKRRQGPHAHDIRALHLTDEGIRIGERVRVPDEQSGDAPLEG
jgi:circadian clock protein KaiC